MFRKSTTPGLLCLVGVECALPRLCTLFDSCSFFLINLFRTSLDPNLRKARLYSLPPPDWKYPALLPHLPPYNLSFSTIKYTPPLDLVHDSLSPLDGLFSLSLWCLPLFSITPIPPFCLTGDFLDTLVRYPLLPPPPTDRGFFFFPAHCRPARHLHAPPFIFPRALFPFGKVMPLFHFA